MIHTTRIFSDKTKAWLPAVPLLLLFLCALLTAAAAPARTDTIRVMQYNLLNYGASHNTVDYKDPRLSTILAHALPDIFGANEISGSGSYVQHIADSVLGPGWEHAQVANAGRQSLVNMLYWKSGKFALQRQTPISHIVRDISAYRLYYRDPDLAQTHDTIFLTVIVVHLKAGNTLQDRDERASETMTVASYINSLGKADNYIVMGDMNLYTSTEQAYVNLVNGPYAVARFYDPLDRPGNWSGNAAFADIHTQSTRRSALSDGGASGGMDDRFDFILVSGTIIQHAAGVRYLENSYHALGQDGQRMNQSVNASNPPNAAAPAQVVQSLYEMSDHLPVYADFVLTPATWTDIAGTEAADGPAVANPFDDRIYLSPGASYAGRTVRIQLRNMMGASVLDEERYIPSASSGQVFPLHTGLPPGVYLLTIADGVHPVITKKLFHY